MLEWKEETVIKANIEKVWSLFLDKNIKSIMPKVEEHILIERKENEVGAKHRQTYREGKRKETYIVETVAYEDTKEKKNKQIRFVLGKSFEISLTFQLYKIDEHNTRFIYEGRNRGVNFVGRAMMKLSSQKSNDKVVKEFMQRVEHEALNTEL
jgi:hypothetical protein